MSQIQLNESLLIAKGGERACYLHPLDNSKVIKILYTQGNHNNQNKLEYIYINDLKRKKLIYLILQIVMVLLVQI